MKLFNYKSLFVMLAFISAGCSTQNIARQPQSSVFEDAEVLSDDLQVEEDYNANNVDDDNQDSERFDTICRNPSSQVLKVNDRVVTQVDGEYVSGNIRESYEGGTQFMVATDYGPQSASRKSLELKRSPNELSKAMDCLGMKSKKVYGLFKVGEKYFTGHVREVYMNGVVRFVNDRFKEQFSTVDQSYLEKLHSKEKLKSVLFHEKGKEIKGQIRRVFEKDVMLVKYGNDLFMRKTHEVAIQD